jgi:uridine kinase
MSNRPHLIGLVGYQTAGKTTAAKLLVKHHG